MEGSDMGAPKSEIDKLNAILYGENIDFLRDDLVFAVASRIVKYHDPELLKQFPMWVSQGVHDVCDMYRRDGSYGIVSALGSVDHSEMVQQLVVLLGGASTESEGK